MHEEELGYAYSTLQSTVLPRLESAGYLTSVQEGEHDGLRFVEVRVALEADENTEVFQVHRWAETFDGKVSVTSHTGMTRINEEADHPMNRVLGNLTAEKFHRLAETVLGYGSTRTPALSSSALLAEMSPDFANTFEKTVNGLQELTAPAADNKGFGERALALGEVLLLAEHAAAKGFETRCTTSLGEPSLDIERVHPAAFLRMSFAQVSWTRDSDATPNVILASKNTGHSGLRDWENMLRVEPGAQERLCASFDRGLAVLENGKSTPEVVANYLLGVADKLKAEGHAVSTTVTPGRDTVVEISVGGMQGDALVSARHIYQIYDRGHASKEILPSVRFQNLPDNHRDNLAMARFDALPVPTALGILAHLREAKLVPESGVGAFPQKTLLEKGFAVLRDAHKIMSEQVKAGQPVTPPWAVSLTQMMHALEAAKELGFDGYSHGATEPGKLAFSHIVKNDPASNEREGWLVLDFHINKSPAGDLNVNGAYLKAEHNYSRDGEVYDFNVPSVRLCSIEDALRTASEYAFTRKDELLAEAKVKYIESKIGECWLESVDPQAGIAHVGVMSQWTDKKLQLVEIKLENWESAGLARSKEEVASQLGFTSEANALKYGSLIEAHVTAVNDYLKDLQKEAAALQMGNIRLAPDHKSVTVAFQGPGASSAKDVKLDIKQSGGQVLLMRADGSKPRRPFRAVDGVRALELLLASAVGQMIAQERALQPAKKKKTPAKTADVER